MGIGTAGAAEDRQARRRVLIAEADAACASMLALHLESGGYGVQSAQSAAQLFSLLERSAAAPFCFLIADLSLPDAGGHALIKRLRTRFSLPLIAILENPTEREAVLALDLGADDVVGKPLRPLELMARLRAQLRRAQAFVPAPAQAAAPLCAGPFTLDTEALRLEKDGEAIPLTLAEYKLLCTLMRRAGEAISKRELYAALSCSAPQGTRGTAWSDENSIMVHISKLREKIEDCPRSPAYIKTVRGHGYRFEAPAAERS